MKIIIGIMGLSAIGLVHAGEAVGTTKTTATMQATCSIEVNPLGFGVVATPLMSQSSQSEMSVKCSNASAYTIDLAYGGIYGTGTYSEYSVAYYAQNAVYNYYSIYNSSGVKLGDIRCGYSDIQYRGKVYFETVTIAQLYGYINTGWQTDSKHTGCVSNNTQSGTYPKGWVGSWNASGKQAVGGGSGYSYGVMNGSFKSDKLAYSIAVPGEPTKVWNVGTNSYKSTGNGDFQVIPVVAKIVPSKSGSQYPAPDMYLDTITAVISY